MKAYPFVQRPLCFPGQKGRDKAPCDKAPLGTLWQGAIFMSLWSGVMGRHGAERPGRPYVEGPPL